MREIWDIHGGIHPPENKLQSNQQAICSAGIPEQLVLPLSQHIGAPANPVVQVGDKVLKGQMIAEAKGVVSVPVHASSSGEVIAIEHRIIPHPSGMTAPCIVIKTDGKDEWVEHAGVEDYTALEKAQLVAMVRNAGIAGMGGAGFPAAVKLNTRADQAIETLIINGTECEPYITADDRLMQERADEIIAGTSILSYIINPKDSVLIGVEDNKPEAITALQKAAEGTNIEIVSFPTKYPSGGEKQLIQILTGKEVPSGGLPAQVGIVCQNIGTTVAIYRAIQHGEPLISRVTTITGFACEQQKNLDVLLGTPIQNLLDQCGFNDSDCPRLIMGGPMMGFSLESTQVPVVKTTNCILAPNTEEIPSPPPAQACIRCGMCAEACPASLLPQQLYWFARGKEYDKLKTHNLMDCIECGACSYACPSNIPLVQYYRASKADIRQQDIDAVKAEQSKARFEARQERIERMEAEKIAKREARKAAAQAKAASAGSNDAKGDAVQAAIERAKAKKMAIDPALAAIEKAKAKRIDGSSEQPTQESLETNLANIDKRLNIAKNKFLQAQQENSDKLEAFRMGVEKTQRKYDQAKEALDSFLKDNIQQHDSAANLDPAQQSIERAKQKRLQQTTLSPREKAVQAVTALQTRIEKAQLKYEKAKEENSDNLDIFENTLANLRNKLQTAQADLKALPIENNNAAQDAISKALSKREAASTMTEKEKLQNAVDTLEKRLAKTQNKLVTAEAENSDNIDILVETVTKLKSKLSDAKAALAKQA